MTNITLRAYHRNIDVMIENKNVNNAVTACRSILETYPKSFHTYKLLGKAFLENQDLDLADRIFNIILDVDPDDFVAHIGKSFISESHSDLPKAINHMKRAFELQPGNEGLQAEIKRLIHKKDGVEPNKIHLTRGALIKMYMHGQLYEQAIGEIQIGLHESPNRTDFKINLAESFYRSEKTIQAAETCVEIVSSFPYAWSPNEILDQIISMNLESKNQNFFKAKLVELDPYYAYMLPTTESVNDVPDIAIMVLDDLKFKDMSEIDWEGFLAEAWGKSEECVSEPILTEEINWEEIINKALETALSIHQSKDDRDQNGVDTKATSRKSQFIEKLRGTQKMSSGEDTIPDWFYDEEITGEDNQTLGLDDDELQEVKKTTSDSNDSQQELNEEDFENLPSENFNSEITESKSAWVSDDVHIIEESVVNHHKSYLEDTQKIPVEQIDFHELMLEAEKAAIGGNINHAKKIFRNLIEEKINLKEVSRELESILQKKPQHTEFLFLLGEVYTFLGEKEKALQVFQKAQKHLSL